MATVRFRSNPDKGKTTPYQCSQCRKPFVDFDKAKACAEKDFKRRTSRSPRKVVTV